jgi:hypothetical protein
MGNAERRCGGDAGAPADSTTEALLMRRPESRWDDSIKAGAFLV